MRREYLIRTNFDDRLPGVLLKHLVFVCYVWDFFVVGGGGIVIVVTYFLETVLE